MTAGVFDYSVLAITRKIPTATITKPAAVNMPENWLMSPAGGLIE